MNVCCNVEFGGSLFSRLMLIFQELIFSVNDLNSIENIKMNISDSNFGYIPNQFNWIYQENNNVIYDTFITSKFRGTYTNDIPQNDLLKLKIIKSKLIINDFIINKINNIKSELSLDENCLGVHIRLTDMNSLHPFFGVFSIDDFIRKIENEIETKSYSKIFIASDNYQSICRLKEIFGDKIIFYTDCVRAHNEIDPLPYVFNYKKLWEDNFIDMFLLSECSTLIHRVSNFANCSKIYSNTINKVINL